MSEEQENGNAPQAEADPEAKTGEGLLIGCEVKALGNGKIGGYLVQFSSDQDPDLTGDFFTKDTYFGDIGTTNVLYHHGMDKTVKTRSIGTGVLRKDDVGIWIEAQLKLADKYEQAIYDMVKAGKLRWSSGTASHLVEREPTGKAMWVKSWPLGIDASLTPTPAEPRNAAVVIKATNGGNYVETQEQYETTASGGEEVKTSLGLDRLTALEQNVKSMELALEQFSSQMAERMAAFMKAVDSAPVQRLGYVSPDGGAADPQVKSLGDFATAVYRGDMKRLERVYSVKLNEASGENGGYLVPPIYEPQIMRMAIEGAIVRPRADVRTIRGREILLPAFDYSGSYSEGNTTALAGMTMDWVAEADTITATEVNFRQMHVVTHKMGKTIPISNELINDSAIALEQTITAMFGDAIAYTEDWNFLRGDGVGKPLGILNAGCLITTGSTLTSTSVKLSEILTMLKRIPEESKRRAVWICNTFLQDALTAMNSETAGSVPMVQDVTQPGRYTLLGIPVLFSEKMPEAFTEGGLLLADLSQYYVVDSGGIAIALSEHVYFSSDQVGIRVTKRVDGQPKWNSARKSGRAASATVSPFVKSK
jgi:HK97 family phage major capsid protein